MLKLLLDFERVPCMCVCVLTLGHGILIFSMSSHCLQNPKSTTQEKTQSLSKSLQKVLPVFEFNRNLTKSIYLSLLTQTKKKKKISFEDFLLYCSFQLFPYTTVSISISPPHGTSSISLLVTSTPFSVANSVSLSI